MNSDTVYLLDDEPDMLQLLVNVVELAGLQPISYSHASHFFEQVKVFPENSILVLDLNMPDIDGIEVMRQLSKSTNPPRLILISGTDIGLLRAAEKLGEAHHLQILSSMTKPINIEELLSLLKLQIESYIEHKDIFFKSKQMITKDELEFAINNNQLTLHYQPQLDMQTAQLIGAESLVRWNHPDLGLLLPDQFIPLAESCQLIGKLTHWVINHSIMQSQQWKHQNINLTMSVNISAKDISSLTLPEQMTQLLIDYNIDPTTLVMEVTESALMDDLVTSLDILTRLRLKGISLSIDDFGTGYSSLSQLHKIPFTELKIDRSFVSNMKSDLEAKAIVKTCIVLAHELNMKAVAEGIEDEETWGMLASLKCDTGQGFYISKPLPGDKFTDWVEAHSK